MKTLFIVAALSLAIGLFAAPHRIARRPRPTHKHHHPVAETFRRIPWQNIASSGAAVSGVVLSYKVGEGLEEGLKTVARESPDSFAVVVFMITLLVTIILISAIGYIIWKICFKRNPERKYYENQ